MDIFTEESQLPEIRKQSFKETIDSQMPQNNKINYIMDSSAVVDDVEISTSDTTTTTIDDDTPVKDVTPTEISFIQNFYDKCNIFLTGGTGFLGKMLIEKLLRSCPGIDNIYLLIRPKQGKDVHSRLEELFDDAIFTKLKEQLPKFRHKIVAIPGDVSIAGLGLKLIDRQLLITKVNIVFHAAATVRFDETLKLAVNINVHGTRDILEICTHMTKLKVIIHVSTAYSNCHLKCVEEKFYSHSCNPDDLDRLIEKLDKKQLEDITPKILGAWPNTYTFTKALAENMIKENNNNLPIGIFRPAIVTSTAHEPFVGWIDNLYGPTGVVAGVGTGVMRTLHCDQEKIACIVPVDMCVNSLIVCAWDVANYFQTKLNNNNNNNINYMSGKMGLINEEEKGGGGIIMSGVTTTKTKTGVTRVNHYKNRILNDNNEEENIIINKNSDNSDSDNNNNINNNNINNNINDNNSIIINNKINKLISNNNNNINLNYYNNNCNNNYSNNNNNNNNINNYDNNFTPIYNYVSSVERPLTWGEFTDMNIQSGFKYPFSHAIWYQTFRMNKSKTINFFYVILLHYLPALLYDGFSICIGQKPRLLKVYKKIHKFSSVISFFCTNEWHFTNTNVQHLWLKLTKRDQELFYFNMRTLNWENYFKQYIKGMRVYLFHDDLSTVEMARKKWRRFYWCHQILKGVLTFILIYTIWSIICSLLY